MKSWSKNIQWIVLGALVMLVVTWIWKRFISKKPQGRLIKKNDMTTYLTDENAAVREEAAKLIAKAAMESDEEEDGEFEEDGDEDADEGDLI